MHRFIPSNLITTAHLYTDRKFAKPQATGLYTVTHSSGVLNSLDKLRTARFEREFTDDGFNYRERNIRGLDAHDSNISHLACFEFLIKLACDLPRPVDQDGNPVDIVNEPTVNSSKIVSTDDNHGNINKTAVSISVEPKPSEKPNAGEHGKINSIHNEPSGGNSNSGVNHDLLAESSPKQVDLDQKKQSLSYAKSRSVGKLMTPKEPPFNFESDQFPIYSSEKYAIPSVYYLLYLIKTRNMIRLPEGVSANCYRVLANSMAKAGFTNFNSSGACHEIYQRMYRIFAYSRTRYCLRLAQRGAIDFRKVTKPRNPIYYKMVGWVTIQNSKVLARIVSKHNLSDILIELDAMHAEDITEKDHKVIEGVFTGPAEELLVSHQVQNQLLSRTGTLFNMVYGTWFMVSIAFIFSWLRLHSSSIFSPRACILPSFIFRVILFLPLYHQPTHERFSCETVPYGPNKCPWLSTIIHLIIFYWHIKSRFSGPYVLSPTESQLGRWPG